MVTPNAATYLSALSANALISDLRPTSISPTALQCLNSLLDELLISLLTASQSLNPYDLRREGVPVVFNTDKSAAQQAEISSVRALGRSAVAEAELELRSWQEGRSGQRGFPPDGKGSGTRAERAFPLEAAVEIMRLKCISFSTLAPQDPVDEFVEDDALLTWKEAGGDSSDQTIEPAALWMTAIIEHVCEHILSSLARVIGRDSEVTIAGAQELYTALCEDESVWGLFKRMKVKDQLEDAIRAGSKHKRATPSRSTVGRASPAFSGSPQASKVSLSLGQSQGQYRDPSTDVSRGMSSSPNSHANEPRSSSETNRFGGITAGVMRKGSQLSKRSGQSSRHPLHLRHNNGNGHERTGSVLSDNTRSMLGAFNSNDEYDEDNPSPQEAQDEFDALVRSGETMKVSLTPSRLKNFDGGSVGRRRVPNDSPGKQNGSPTSVRRNAGAATAASTSASRPASIATYDQTPVQPSAFPAPPGERSHNLVTADQANQSPTRSTAPSSPQPQSSPGDSARSGRARGDSAQNKLLARAATTIDEDDESENRSRASGLRSHKKESLMELLASEGMYEPGGSPATSEKSNIKRSVPAVVLGTPPPPPPEPTMKGYTPTPPSQLRGEFSPSMSNPSAFTSPSSVNRSEFTSPQSLPRTGFSPPAMARSQYSSSSLNRPNGVGPSREPSGGEDDEESDLNGVRQRKGQSQTKRKTEAQELADFFNTPPPMTVSTFISSEEDPPPQTAKSNKGFRALVSKVKGSKKKDDKDKDKDPSEYRDRDQPLSRGVQVQQSTTISSSASHGRLSSISRPQIAGWAGFEDGTSPPQAAGLSTAASSSAVSGLSGGGIMPRKLKSMHNLASVPTAFRPFANEEATSPAQLYAAQQRRGSKASTVDDTNTNGNGNIKLDSPRVAQESAERGVGEGRRGSASAGAAQGAASKKKMVGLGIATIPVQAPSTSPASDQDTRASANISPSITPSQSRSQSQTRKSVPTLDDTASKAKSTMSSDIATPYDREVGYNDGSRPNTTSGTKSQSQSQNLVADPSQVTPSDIYPSPISVSSFRTANEGEGVGESERAETRTIVPDPVSSSRSTLPADGHRTSTRKDERAGLNGAASAHASSATAAPLLASTAAPTLAPVVSQSNTSAHAVHSRGQLSPSAPVASEAVFKAPAPADASAGNIPLADLIPLRHLLDHATSARECRILLSAILTQFGVPLAASSRTSRSQAQQAQAHGQIRSSTSATAAEKELDSVKTQPDLNTIGHGQKSQSHGIERDMNVSADVEVTPEDRVMAWLLAGREGPVGDIVSPTAVDRRV